MGKGILGRVGRAGLHLEGKRRGGLNEARWRSLQKRVCFELISLHLSLLANKENVGDRKILIYW